MVLQVRRRGTDAEPGPVRYGITASRKVGKAVVRNRVRRRLKAAAETILPAHAAGSHDYVLIGRTATAVRPFAELLKDLEIALQRLHAYRGSLSARTDAVKR